MTSGQMADQNDALYEKWGKWIEKLHRDIVDIFDQRQMFWEWREIIEKNEKIQNPADFHLWVATMYANSMSVAVRRICDDDKRVIPYRNLLERIKLNPKVISRSRFRDNFVSPPNYTLAEANEDFDKYAGKGNEYLDQSLIDQDINELVAESKIVKTYVDKRLAHYENKKFVDVPKYEDLHKAVEHLGKLHQKYHGLFCGLSIASLVPHRQWNWTTIFYHPWINLGSIPLPPPASH
jgi:hypothetical protein